MSIRPAWAPWQDPVSKKKKKIGRAYNRQFTRETLRNRKRYLNPLIYRDAT
jgi:hypothetical protein